VRKGGGLPLLNLHSCLLKNKMKQSVKEFMGQKLIPTIMMVIFGTLLIYIFKGVISQ
jgi:hypothetical protein